MANAVAAARKAFFDRDKILAAVEEGQRRVLSRFGAFVRQRARTSMRRRKKASAPGSPPSAHRGQLKNLLYFGWDAKTRSVVVGPVPFSRGEAPHLNEFGGVATRWIPVSRVRKAATAKQAAAYRRLLQSGAIPRPPRQPRVKVPVRATYGKRPFMRPALEKETAKFAGLFKASMGG